METAYACCINNWIATSREHLYNPEKKPFHRQPYCVPFHFPSHSSSKTILIHGNSLGSTDSTQLMVALTTHTHMAQGQY